jgi:hypothetical protein
MLIKKVRGATMLWTLLVLLVLPLVVVGQTFLIFALLQFRTDDGQPGRIMPEKEALVTRVAR